MPLTTLISTGDLALHLDDPDWAVVDCRFDLLKPEWGEGQYRAGHIPGAVYAHLDRDLSGPKTGRNGRHPLPDLETFKAQLGRWGIGPGVQVVVYDQTNGGYAARLWWMLRYLEHTAVALLDGGWAKWQREGRSTRAGLETRAPRPFVGQPRREMWVDAITVDRLRQDPQARVIDARTAERHRGENEPIDPVAGRIPGAVSLPYVDLLTADQTLLDPQTLRERVQAALGEVAPDNSVVYCGSGVTSCLNLVALEHAGLPGARLYVGSWSDWISDPGRPVAKGPSDTP